MACNQRVLLVKAKLVRVLKIVFIVAAICVGVGFGYLQLPKFGALPEDDTLARLEDSPNYRNGAFQNLEPIPETTVDPESERTWLDVLFSEDNGRTPPRPLPTVKTDLHALEQNQDVMIWLGHSSFFIQLDGKTFLIDPVLSQNASPIPFTNQAFAGTSIYTAEDFPEIDYLLISHDHWDHLDYSSVSALRDKIGTIVTGLGVGAHFERWGFPPSQIHEADWNTSLTVDEGYQLHILPARHFSGRWLERDQSLWVAFALKSPTRSLFFSGDSGYGNHFREIGNALGGFDLAMLDVGQYDLQWRYVHMLPEDAANASRDLNAKAMMPAHVGKFSMAFHRWDEPFRELSAMQGDLSPSLVTPLIGETVDLSQIGRGFTPWWRLGEDQQTQLAESEG